MPRGGKCSRGNGMEDRRGERASSARDIIEYRHLGRTLPSKNNLLSFGLRWANEFILLLGALCVILSARTAFLTTPSRKMLPLAGNKMVKVGVRGPVVSAGDTFRASNARGVPMKGTDGQIENILQPWRLWRQKRAEGSRGV